MQLKGGLYVVNLGGGDKVELQKDWVDNFLEASCWQAQLCRGRFLEERGDLDGTKCHFFRELDRHTMYYVRARRKLLAEMRGMAELHAGHDFGVLSDEEAQAVVLSTVLFRLYNRLGTFVRWELMKKYVREPASAPPKAWTSALERLSAEDVAELHRAERKLQKGVEPSASLAAAVPPTQLVGFLNFVEGVMDRRGVVDGDRQARPASVFCGA